MSKCRDTLPTLDGVDTDIRLYAIDPEEAFKKYGAGDVSNNSTEGSLPPPSENFSVGIKNPSSYDQNICQRINNNLAQQESKCSKKAKAELTATIAGMKAINNIVYEKFISPIKDACSTTGEFASECRRCYHQRHFANDEWYLGPRDCEEVTSKYGGEPTTYKPDSRFSDERRGCFCMKWTPLEIMIRELELCNNGTSPYYEIIGQFINKDSKLAKKACKEHYQKEVLKMFEGIETIQNYNYKKNKNLPKLGSNQTIKFGIKANTLLQDVGGKKQNAKSRKRKKKK